MFNLSVLYREGYGVCKNLNRAYLYCEDAAQRGYTMAQVDGAHIL
jgi:TPR repeat protein